MNRPKEPGFFDGGILDAFFSWTYNRYNTASYALEPSLAAQSKEFLPTGREEESE